MDIKNNKQNEANSKSPCGGFRGLELPNDFGYYGEFGGAYIPEILHGSF